MDKVQDPTIESLIAAVLELLPLLDKTVLQLRYDQDIPGLSSLEYRILDYTCHHAPLRVGEIAAMSGLSFPNASTYVKELISKGFLLSQPDPSDRRAQCLSLSPEGSQLLDQVQWSSISKARSLLGTLDNAERISIETACRRLTNSLKPVAVALAKIGKL